MPTNKAKDAAAKTTDNFGFESGDGKPGDVDAPDKPKAQSSGLVAKAVIIALLFLIIGLGVGYVVAPADTCPDAECPTGSSTLTSTFADAGANTAAGTAYGIDRGLYDAIDTDGSGTVSPAEFQAFMDGVARFVDTDADGSMSFAEAAAGNGPPTPTAATIGGVTATTAPPTAATIGGVTATTAPRTTETPTLAPTRAPVVFVPVPHTGNIFITNPLGALDPSNPDPRSFATTNYSTITNVTGWVAIDHNGGLATLDGGYFGALRGIAEYCQVYSNNDLTTLGDSFGALRTIGQAVRSDGVTGMGLAIFSNRQLVSLGTAFRSLERIEGTLHIRRNYRLTDFEALRNLQCHGGIQDDDPTEYCYNCPAWLINKPRC